MAKWAMIALTLPKIEDPERDAFYEKLHDRDWIKSDEEDTLWKKDFYMDSMEDIVKSLNSDLIAAQQGSSLIKFTASFQIANSEPFTLIYKWDIRKGWAMYRTW